MTRNADRDPDPDPDPDRACAREWQPAEAPERRPEPKREDEPVQWASEVAIDASDPDPDPEPKPQRELDADPDRERPRTDPSARADGTQERDHAACRAGGGVELDVGGRDG